MRKPSSFLMRAIQTAVAGHSAQNDQYNLYWINDCKSLDFACERGLLSLYQRVFAEAPYYEEFTGEQVYREFQETLKQLGLIFMATEKQGLDRVRGFVSSLPLLNVPDVASSVKNIVDLNKTAYFAEDGVDKDYRRRGISRLMKNALIQANWMSGAEHIVLRTSDHNYRQVAAVSKEGGQVISNIFQNVTNARQGGQIMQDRRAFYLFTPENEIDYDYLHRVIIVRPGGNDTAVVWDNIPRPQQNAIAASIQKNYPGIEQVMFVEKNPENGLIRGQMAGGEFCGNASRSLGYLLLDCKDGSIDVEVSGASKLTKITVKEGRAGIEIPIKSGFENIKTLSNGEKIVDLDGISHLITYEGQETAQRLALISDLEERKNEVRKILAEIGLANQSAAGVMVTKILTDGRQYLDPYVNVRDTGTLYYESACGSGSTAVGLAQAVTCGNNIIDLEIVQPSGLSLIVNIRCDSKSILKASVDGPIEILFDSRMYLPRKTIVPKPALSL